MSSASVTKAARCGRLRRALVPNPVHPSGKWLLAHHGVGPTVTLAGEAVLPALTEGHLPAMFAQCSVAGLSNVG